MKKPTAIPTVRDLQGNIITPADLPSPATNRWTPNRKAIVVRAIGGGLISLQEAQRSYNLTEAELLMWEKGLKEEGADGLKITHFQKRKKNHPYTTLKE